ncbi:MAG: metallophosphoesterase family protein [Bdellovibrionaceae bacterium]|nr:metallophosphoesterase family protein [Pseudobdellovibrionaceae bacterium]
MGRVRSLESLNSNSNNPPPGPLPPNGPPPLPPIDDSIQDKINQVTRGPYLQMSTSHSIVIRWRTSNPTRGRLRLGPAPDRMVHEFEESQPSREHEVLATGLREATRYFYSIGSESGRLAGLNDQHYFVTHPIIGTVKPTRIWVLGDSGTKDANARAVRDAYYSKTGNQHTDLWLMLGDNAYTDGTDTEFQAAVFDMYPRMLRTSALFPTRGNHERDDSPYYQIFTMPTKGEAGGLPSGSEAYYSFDYANIHFVCLDSTGSSRLPTSAMAKWLKDDLANNSALWTIAYWHHPPYSKGSHDSDSEGALVEMREHFLPILEDYGVDLVMAGHSHSYERSVLLDGHYGNSSSLRSSMILNTGDGRANGNGAYQKDHLAHKGAVYVVAGSSGKVSGGSLNHPVMKVNLRELGSLILEINGNRMDTTFIRENGDFDDTFTILKNSTQQRAPADTE